MRKSSVKKLLIVVTLIVMLAIVSTKVQATGGIVNPLLNIQGILVPLRYLSSSVWFLLFL